MSIFEGDLFKLGEKQTSPVTAAPAPDEIARGAGWSVSRRDGRCVVSYISGEFAGREKAVDINEDEAEALAAGSVDLDTVLISQDAG